MILFDLAFELTAGALCAVAERERLAAEPRPLGLPSFRAGLVYSALFYVPAVVLFVRLWPDWSSHYLFDAAARPVVAALFAGAASALMFVSYVAGYLVAAQRIRRRRLRALLAALGAGWAALLVILFVALGDRSLAVTTTAEFRATTWPTFGLPWGDPRGLHGRPIMWALLVSGAWNSAPLALLYAWLRRGVRRGELPVADRARG